jgi:valyl-tRNA synthetase
VIAGELEALAHRGDGAGDAAARDAERARLERELEEARGWLASAQARLANEAFVSKAPPTRR